MQVNITIKIYSLLFYEWVVRNHRRKIARIGAESIEGVNNLLIKLLAGSYNGKSGGARS